MWLNDSFDDSFEVYLSFSSAISEFTSVNSTNLCSEIDSTGVQSPHLVLFPTLYKNREGVQSTPFEAMLEPPVLLECLVSVWAYIPCSPSLIHFFNFVRIYVQRSSVSHMVCSPEFPSNSNPSTFLIVSHTAYFFRIFLSEMASSLSYLSGGNTPCIPVSIALATWCSLSWIYGIANTM